MNAVQLLLKDHEEIKAFFRQFEEAGERAYKTKQTIAEKAIEELKSHSQLEERIFYPTVQEKAKKELQAVIREGIEEHRVVDFLMERLQQTKPEDETFDAKFKVLIESVEHHLKEEERELFPESKKLLDKEELDRLGAEMEALEEQLEG
jgi:hemerythrin-like domain-containing protein